MTVKPRRRSSRVTMPIEPTKEQLLAGLDVLHDTDATAALARACYTAFIATRPGRIKRKRVQKK